MNADDLVQLAYLVSVALFVVGLKRLAGVRTARQGNLLLAAGMFLAVVITLVEQGRVDFLWIAVGIVAGAAVGVWTVLRATAVSMPQVVARFNGFGGAASAFVALALFWDDVVGAAAGSGSAFSRLGAASAITLVLSVVIGGATFSGSIAAEAKLWGKLSGLTSIAGRSVWIALATIGAIAAAVVAVGVDESGLAATAAVILLVISAAVGVLAVGPVGGADMPVMISLLNSLSGLAAAATGFALGNTLLIMGGTIVGAAGLMLTQIMCVAMNRSLLNVLAGGLGDTPTGGDADVYENVVSSDAEEAAMVLEIAQSVIIVPGYGLAAARAQHSAAELADVLAERGVQVRFAIHPVAGRMPGHMNVVLAEADVPYERLVEMEMINRDFSSTDVVIVVGANDVTNPSAREASGSPIAGMPILEVDQAQRVFVIKRSLSPGYAGIKNPLYEADNCAMLFGDAKQVLDELVQEVAAPV